MNRAERRQQKAVLEKRLREVKRRMTRERLTEAQALFWQPPVKGGVRS